MSTDSLVETTYESLDEVCKLIDEIVLAALDQNGQPAHDKLQLAAHILAPSQDDLPSIGALIIDCLLRSPVGQDLINRDRLSRCLLEANLDQQTLADLKRTAEILNSERQRTAHRLMKR